jgi:hypothetical protein
MNHFSKGGVYDTRKRGEAFRGAEDDMWRRWKAGESLHEIGRAFGKSHASIQFLLLQRGGIVPAAVIQASMPCLTQIGMATVRMRMPLSSRSASSSRCRRSRPEAPG